jgi:hypothetical protein
MIMIKKQLIISVIVLGCFFCTVAARAATSQVNFDPGTGTLSVAGSCSGRFVLIIIKNSSTGSIWGSSNPPCVSGTYSYSLVISDSVRTGATFIVNVMDNGVAGSGGIGPSQPVIFSQAPGTNQTANSSSVADLSITLDTSSLATAPDDTSFLDGVLQDCFGIITSALNSAEASVVAAVHLFAKIFTIIPGGSITVPQGQNQISGQGSLAAGASEVFIANTAVTSSSQIIVTPTSASQLPLSVMQITGGDGFDVGTISPQQIGVSFTWLIINTYNAGPPTQAGLQQGSPSVGVVQPPADTSDTTPDVVPTDSSSTDDTNGASSTIVVTTTDATTTDDVATTSDTTTTDTSTTDIIDIATTTDATGTTQ